MINLFKKGDLKPNEYSCKKCKTLLPFDEKHFPKNSRQMFALEYTCRRCKNAKTQTYYKEKTEKGVSYYQRNKREMLDYSKNRRKEKLKDPEYVEAERKRNREWSRYFREANRDIYNSYHNKYKKEYLKTDVGRMRERISNYKSQCRLNYRRELKIDFDVYDWYKAKLSFDNCCAYCGRNEDTTGNLMQEHIIPLSKGGEYTKDNIVPSCRSCNSTKKTHDLISCFKGRVFKREVLYLINDFISLYNEELANNNLLAFQMILEKEKQKYNY